MLEIQVAKETSQLVREGKIPQLTVSSAFEYTQGSSNSPFIITSSIVSELNEKKSSSSRRISGSILARRPRKRRTKSHGRAN